MTTLSTFCRQIRSRSQEHLKAMSLVARAGLASQMVAILRQELDSMIRVVYLLAQPIARREDLIEAAVNGVQWTHEGKKSKVTDREMVDLAVQLRGWTQLAYTFGCNFIHLSHFHDYSDRDPLLQMSERTRSELLSYLRSYHEAPSAASPTFADVLPLIPQVLEKISGNLEEYIDDLESGSCRPPGEV